MLRKKAEDPQYSFEALQEKIGYQFKNVELLHQALTHSSFTNEQKINKVKHYERLEFLGDAVLELVSSEFLFKEHEDCPEGELTKMRAAMVCEPSLAFCAKDLELGKYMRLGKGEEMTGGRKRDSITSDAMEAVIGAIFLDGGMEQAKDFIYRFILNDIDNKRLFFDSKTKLQELIQGKIKKEFHYEPLEEKGPEHEKTFGAEVVMENESLGKGFGRTKKAAEQQAAYQALLRLRELGYVLKKH